MERHQPATARWCIGCRRDTDNEGTAKTTAAAATEGAEIMGSIAGLQSDAFVFYGATGDLAYKQVFPALYAMVRDGYMSIPIIGVAGRSWTSDQLRQRAHESLAEHGDMDHATFARLASL